ncbi:MAG TPA: septum formation initiator family protein [Terriglobales bacterium]|nr:septum formation initiator family protein [Terriglobales bacterium]
MTLLPSPPSKYKGWLALGAVLLLSFAALTLFGEGGLTELLHTRREQRALEGRILEQQERNQALRRKIERLQSDDAFIERQARVKLGLVKPGELVYRDPVAASASDR